ncbi:PREDICTED: HVA22-like protein f isoform X2 [Tarenaya hassleriana]|uniref:HVA22-like protein f isoform X2 n=1 Tax=Tarenaya hassleriana TaxID=28532 RepID=UPI0008FD2B8E|nr:PREDICTED: HVA22-like protein f isoform X2 [Tarenaya hassleriana]
MGVITVIAKRFDALIGYVSILIRIRKECMKNVPLMSNIVLSAFGGMCRPGVMLLYPLYASLRAIESPTMLDDQQWLTYWIIYSFMTLFEMSVWRILAWIPFWPYMKLLFCMWLVLPMFSGAAYIYSNMVRKYVKIGAYVGGKNYTEEQRKVLQMMSLDARSSVQHYIDLYGWDAVERAIKAAERETKRH